MRQCARNPRAFVKLHKKYGRMDIYSADELRSDIANLERPPVLLRDAPYHVAYLETMK